MKFRPLHDRVVIKRIEADEKSSGGIIIPDTAKEKPQEGEVIAVGPGGRDESGKLIPIDVKVGDRVLFGKWSGTEVKLDGVEYIIMKESDLMGCWWKLEVQERPPDPSRTKRLVFAPNPMGCLFAGTVELPRSEATQSNFRSTTWLPRK